MGVGAWINKKIIILVICKVSATMDYQQHIVYWNCLGKVEVLSLWWRRAFSGH